MPVTQALRLMLRDTGFDFVMIDTHTFRIVHKIVKATPPPPKPSLQRRVRPAPLLPAPPAELPDIIVSASKQQQSLMRYPGSAQVEMVGSVGMSADLGSDAIVARLPALTSTNLGPGRNKIFVRGVADSSFAGPTQSTVGLYLGDLRITYNAPEPGLRLYDVDKIEVIEGPQGTLYGAGALGGIVRIIPHPPQMDRLEGSVEIGGSASQRGAASYDLGATINLPLLPARAALRVTGYQQREGGYIDNAITGARDINTSKISGARATLRIQPGAGWTVDLQGVAQDIATRDGQYAEIGRPRYTQGARIAQPHDNDFRAISLSVNKLWGRVALISTTGLVSHDLNSTFDATGFEGRSGILAYQEGDRIRLLSHETRLSGKAARDGSWVAGISLLSNTDWIDRTLGPPGAPAMLTALRNNKTEAALFGEATLPLSQRWFATLGARLAWSHTVGEFLGVTGGAEPRSNVLRLLPTAAVSWKPKPDWLAYLRYQSGFRSGGIAISSGSINAAQRFGSDTIHTGELGLRFGNDRSRFSGSLAGFVTLWNSIQADLISANGLPFTDNIGQGRIYGAEASLVWKPTRALTLDGLLLLNDSALIAPALGFEKANESSLPNIARASGRLSFDWKPPIFASANFDLNGTLRYIGASSLGTTAPLVLEQGETLQADLSTSVAISRWKIALSATNIFNRGGNRFSYGNPFSAGLGNQITPLRPRTVRLGIRLGF